MSEDLPLRDQLERYYQENTDPEIKISDFTPISDGWETEVYSFTLTLRHQVEHLILRVYPGDKQDAAQKCEREYQGMLGLGRAAGYPVPLVMRHQTDTSRLGKPFLIMQKINGRPLGDVMRENIARRPELLTRFVKLAVDLHQIDYRPVVDPYSEHNPADALPDLLAMWRGLAVNHHKQTWSVAIFDWLDAHIAGVPSTQVSPLHGDFHPHNVLITPDDALYVIDWSGFSVGDYRVDLAWTLLLLSTQGYPELRPIILSEYEHLSGHSIEHIEYFDVIAALRRLFDFAASLTSGAESLGMRPETVAVMRRQHDHYQQVYDLLCQRTGLRLPEIERLLDTLKG